jgi:hypothetical protein
MVIDADRKLYTLDLKSGGLRNFSATMETFEMTVAQGTGRRSFVVNRRTVNTFNQLPHPGVKLAVDYNISMYDDGPPCSDRDFAVLEAHQVPLPLSDTTTHIEDFIEVVFKAATQDHHAEYRDRNPHPQGTRSSCRHCGYGFTLPRSHTPFEFCSGYCTREAGRLRVGFYRGLGLQNPSIFDNADAVYVDPTVLVRDEDIALEDPEPAPRPPPPRWIDDRNDDGTTTRRYLPPVEGAHERHERRLVKHAAREAARAPQRTAAQVRNHLVQVQARAGGSQATVTDILNQLRLYPLHGSELKPELDAVAEGLSENHTGPTEEEEAMMAEMCDYEGLEENHAGPTEEEEAMMAEMWADDDME